MASAGRAASDACHARLGTLREERAELWRRAADSRAAAVGSAMAAGTWRVCRLGAVGAMRESRARVSLQGRLVRADSFATSTMAPGTVSDQPVAVLEFALR